MNINSAIRRVSHAKGDTTRDRFRWGMGPIERKRVKRSAARAERRLSVALALDELTPEEPSAWVRLNQRLASEVGAPAVRIFDAAEGAASIFIVAHVGPDEARDTGMVEGTLIDIADRRFLQEGEDVAPMWAFIVAE